MFDYSISLRASISRFLGSLGLTPVAYYALPEAERQVHYRAWLESIDPTLGVKLDVPLPEVDRGKEITRIVKHLSNADAAARDYDMNDLLTDVAGV